MLENRRKSDCFENWYDNLCDGQRKKIEIGGWVWISIKMINWSHAFGTKARTAILNLRMTSEWCFYLQRSRSWIIYVLQTILLTHVFRNRNSCFVFISQLKWSCNHSDLVQITSYKSHNLAIVFKRWVSQDNIDGFWAL